MIQTILIPTDKFSLEKAIKWMKDNKYKHSKVDVTEHFYRFRQTLPVGHKYYTKTLPNRIELVYTVM